MTNQNSKNESERIFEQYLDQNGFQGKWIYEASTPGKIKQPDYLLKWKGRKHFLEIKELRKKPNEPSTRSAHIDPYSSLRSKIRDVRKQFKEYKKYSCSLVVFNVDDGQARLKPIFVLGAMLGNLGLKMDYDPNKGEAVAGSERNAFLDNGRMIDTKRSQPQNTTISAVVVLDKFLDNIDVEKVMQREMTRQRRKFTGPEFVKIRMKLYESHHVRSVPRVVVVENPFARIELPSDLFNGPFDERWRWRRDMNGELERVFVGSKLRELETLKES